MRGRVARRRQRGLLRARGGIGERRRDAATRARRRGRGGAHRGVAPGRLARGDERAAARTARAQRAGSRLFIVIVRRRAAARPRRDYRQDHRGALRRGHRRAAACAGRPPPARDRRRGGRRRGGGGRRRARRRGATGAAAAACARPRLPRCRAAALRQRRSAARRVGSDRAAGARRPAGAGVAAGAGCRRAPAAPDDRAPTGWIVGRGPAATLSVSSSALVARASA